MRTTSVADPYSENPAEGPGPRKPAGPPPGYRPPRPPRPDSAAPTGDPLGEPGETPHQRPEPAPSAEFPQEPATAQTSAGPQISTPEVQLPGFVKSIRLQHVLSLALAQLAGYVALISLAVLTVIGLLIGVGLDTPAATSDPAADLAQQLELSGVAAFLTLPFQIAGVWLFGRFGFTMTAQDESMHLLGLWAPNLLALLLAGLIAVVVGRFWAQRDPRTRLVALPLTAKLALSAAVSLVMALLTLLVTLALAFRQTTEMPFTGEVRMVGSAAGASLFFGAFCFYLLIGLLLSASRKFYSKGRGRIESVLPSAYRVPRVLAIHGILLVIPVLIFTLIWLAVQGSFTAVLSFPFWASTAAVIAFVLLTSGALRAEGGLVHLANNGPGQNTLYLWTTDLQWWQVLLAVLLGVLGLVAAALLWSLRRDSRPEALANPLSWVTLPLIYAAVGVVLTFFGQIQVGFSAGWFGFSTATFGPAWWTFAILLIIGLVIEALARYAAPAVTAKLPPSLVGFIRK